MRYPLIAATLVATVSSQAYTYQGTEYSGFNSLSISTALNSGNANYSQMVAALTDDSALSGVANVGALTNHPSFTANNGTLEGTFAKALLSSSTPSTSGIAFFGGGYNGSWGSFKVELRLADGTYTKSVPYAAATFVDTGVNIPGNNIFHNIANFGTYITGDQSMTKVTFSLTSFGSLYGQDVVGARITEMTSAFPDINFIGVFGTLGAGAPSVPEASTYGFALGGLAIAAAVVRRRKSSK